MTKRKGRGRGDGVPQDDQGEPLGAEGQETLLAEVATLDDRAPAQAAQATSKALAHLVGAVLVLGLVGLVPYASDALSRWRAWTSEDGVPIVRMFLTESPTVAVATGGAGPGSTSRTQVEEQLGAAVAANLDETAPASPPEPTQPSDDGGPAVRIDPRELEGLVRELEDPSGRAMRPFYEALLRTAERQDGAITRVAHYGDSSIAGDGITSTLRRRFQQRFGDAGHGFVLVARGTMPYRHQDVRHDSSGDWRISELSRGGLREDTYGYGGIQQRSASGGTARFETSENGPNGTHVSRFELWFQRHPRGGRVELRVDQGERQIVETSGPTLEDGWHVVEVPDGPHRLDLRTVGGGESRLFGMVLERSGPGVVWDSLGMVGARGRRMLGYNQEHFASQHAHRQTNLIVIAFGGNEADDRMSLEQFEQGYRDVARMVRRARPDAACLFMAPLDQAERDERGNIRTMEPVPLIVEAQRRAAAAEGCAFFDTFAAMGGDGAMRRWYRSNPRLAFGDFRHATPAGYTVIGNMLYKAILKGFADYLEAQQR